MRPTSTSAPEVALAPRARAAFQLIDVEALAMLAGGRFAPALTLKKLHSRNFVGTDFGEALDDVRFAKSFMEAFSMTR